MFALALCLAVFSHPVGVIALLGLLAVGMAVSMPLTNFGAFTPATAGLLLGLGSILNAYAAGVTAGTIPANYITGAMTCYLNSAATTPGNQTTRTAALLYSDLLAELGVPFLPTGFTWEILITQTGANTFTLVGGTGVTIVGTATILTNTTRTYVAQFTGTPGNPTFSLTSVSVGSYS